MRLVACKNCHAQYDVSEVAEPAIRCRCGEEVPNQPLSPVDAQIRRCGSCGAAVSGDATQCEYCDSVIVRDEAALSLICPECYARNEEQSRFCTVCGVAFQPEPIPADQPELPCVRCGGLMPVRPVGGVLVNECPGCHGLWVPGDSFDALVSRAIEAQRSAEAGTSTPRVTSGNPVLERVQYRKCPVCESLMLRRNFRKTSGVVIDRCREHGTWLDADELEQIAGFVLSGGMERARDAESTTMKTAERKAKASPASADFHRILMESRPHSGERRLFESLAGFLNDLLS